MSHAVASVYFLPEVLDLGKPCFSSSLRVGRSAARPTSIRRRFATQFWTLVCHGRCAGPFRTPHATARMIAAGRRRRRCEAIGEDVRSCTRWE